MCAYGLVFPVGHPDMAFTACLGSSSKLLPHVRCNVEYSVSQRVLDVESAGPHTVCMPLPAGRRLAASARGPLHGRFVSGLTGDVTRQLSWRLARQQLMVTSEYCAIRRQCRAFVATLPVPLSLGMRATTPPHLAATCTQCLVPAALLAEPQLTNITPCMRTHRLVCDMCVDG